MDIVFQAILGVLQPLLTPVCRHTKYLLKYKENKGDLERKVEYLFEEVGRLRWKVRSAERNGKIPSRSITQWFNEVDAFKAKKRKIYSFNGRRICKRYYLGKKTAKLVLEVNQLLQDLERHMGNFADNPPPEPVMELATTTVTDQPSTQRLLAELLHLVKDEKADAANIIGVYGVGGVGKTTLIENFNNELKKCSHGFGTIIMVKVTQKVDILKIQKKICGRMGIQNPIDELDLLRKELGKVKYLLIFDDLWERLELNDIGIPAPENGSKIIFTTRSLKVCTAMKAEMNIEVKCLPPDEAWELFVRETSPHVNKPAIKCLAGKMLERCKGLPLAITTVARDMAGKERVEEWHDAERELHQAMEKFEGMVESVFISLKLSYDKLKDEIHKSCFLLCSLLPDLYEDHHREIIERCLLGEALLDGIGNIQQSRNKVVAVIESLRRACLIQKKEYLHGQVTMLDLVREMGVWVSGIERHKITFGRMPRYSYEWADNERISLMHYGLEEFPPHLFCPETPKLVTLLLGSNPKLKRVPDVFFQNMHLLRVLDLSDTAIESLPPSFRCLVNLRVLLLHGCGMLADMPPMGHLKQLRVLDVSFTDLKELPSTISELSNIQSLHIDGQDMRPRPGMFSSLPKLEELSMTYRDRHDETTKKSMKELASLSDLNLSIEVSGSSILLDDELCFLAKFMKKLVIYHCQSLEQIPHNWVSTFERLESLEINYSKFKSLMMIAEEMQAVQRLKKLCLGHLGNLENILQGVVPPGCFTNLEFLEVRDCNRLKVLFSTGMVQQLESLQSIVIDDCSELEKLFVEEVEDDSGIFLHLRRMQLTWLPKLSNICSCRLSWPSLESLVIRGCPNLSLEGLPPGIRNAKNLREVVFNNTQQKPFRYIYSFH
ncbi:disease resistance protein RPS2 [Cinnamomum micranthum f. kanehirae]|uniref:Disease resistance protein RPS2 n=1 Tax=Cinnamomum micranthum f. kanehirae TaxID=337451 RepID=A0A3S3MLY4_9MAGN|nr:disease resistance protein RPS2 [Cinnamomum micranthum f. kanehirae]